MENNTPTSVQMPFQGRSADVDTATKIKHLIIEELILAPDARSKAFVTLLKNTEYLGTSAKEALLHHYIRYGAPNEFVAGRDYRINISGSAITVVDVMTAETVLAILVEN